MAWRRKRKADEKAAPGKRRTGKASVGSQPTESNSEVQDEEAGISEHSEATGAFFGCYLLSSINPKKKGATYIGFTVNPARRLRQHNGELTAGAWKTKRMRPVEMVLVVYGFSSMVHALQFEWAWQHPTVSLAVKEAAAAIKNRAGVKGKIALLYAMLNLPKWKKLPLVVQFVSSRHVVHKLRCPPLPEHMDCILAPLSSLRIKVDETAQDPPIRDPPDDPGASGPPETGPEESDPAQDQDETPPLDASEAPFSPPSPRALGDASSDDPGSYPSTSSWADPMADWDWLDQDGCDANKETEANGWQQDERPDPFSTWQVLKVPKRVSNGASDKEKAQILGLGDQGVENMRGVETEFRESLEARGQAHALASLREGPSEKGGEAAQDWQPEFDAKDIEDGGQAGPSKRGGLGLDSSTLNSIKEGSCLARLAPTERGDMSGGAVAGGCHVRETIDLVDCEENDVMTGHIRGPGKDDRKRMTQRSRCTEKGNEPKAQRCHDQAGFTSGTELVVLEDSPSPRKHKESENSMPAPYLTGIRQAPSAAQTSALWQTKGKEKGQSKGGRSWLSSSTAIIDLDP